MVHFYFPRDLMVHYLKNYCLGLGDPLLYFFLMFNLVFLYQVFGTDNWYWFVPAYSEEDIRRMPALQGLEYPSKPDFDSQEF
jgi:hypothetical protein